MRSALVLAIVVTLVAASIGTGYEFGNATSHTETTTSTALSSTTLTEVSTATATVTVTSSNTPTWTVIVQNGTFMGPACGPSPAQVFMALRIPCLDYSNSSTWYASVLKYNGKDFYAANETVGSTNSGIATTYTVWFDNSTAYCVSPYLSVSDLPTCPRPEIALWRRRNETHYAQRSPFT